MFFPTPRTPVVASSFRAALRRAVDTVVSFALLEDLDVPSPPDPVDTRDLHPHHGTRPTRDRIRRPGAPVAREQDCLTPVTARTRQRTSSTLHHAR